MKDLMVTLIVQDLMEAVHGLSNDEFFEIANEIVLIDTTRNIWLLDFDGCRSWYTLSLDFKLLLITTDRF
jgi:hypothetical protein